MLQFLSRKTGCPHRHTHPDTHTYTHNGPDTGPSLSQTFASAEVAVWKWASQKREAQDEARYSFAPRGVRTTRGWGESAHCPHAPHTYIHMAGGERPLPQLSPICCNICQRKVKMSVNWGYFIHLAVSASHSLSSHSQLRLWGGRAAPGGEAPPTSATREK